MRLLLSVCVTALASAVSTNSFARDRPLCPTKSETATDSAFAEAVRSVFSKTRQSGASKECASPLKLLRFGDADVLLTLKGPRDDDAITCHGCGGILSAFVLRRTPAGPKPVARFVDFAELGSSGNPGTINAAQLAGHDAFSVESGGTFQGYTFVNLSFFLFRGGRLEGAKPDLPLSADNRGAADNNPRAFDIEGAWRIDRAQPDAVTIDYMTKVGKASRRSRATWVLKDTTLTLVAGRPPKEFDGGGSR